MISHYELSEKEAQPTLSIRTHAAVQDLPRIIGETYGKIGQFIGEQGIQIAGIPFIGYFNLDMQNLDIEIGFPIEQRHQGHGEILSSEIPAGYYASVLYKGIYAEMGPAYDALKQYVEQSGFEPTGVVYEFYLNSPDEAALEDLETRIVFPVVKKQ